MFQERCRDDSHTPKLIERLDEWEDSKNVCYTAVYQCAVCGFRWSEETLFQRKYNPWRGCSEWIQLF